MQLPPTPTPALSPTHALPVSLAASFLPSPSANLSASLPASLHCPHSQLIMELVMLLELSSPDRYHGEDLDSLARKANAQKAAAEASGAGAAAALAQVPGRISTDVAALEVEAQAAAAAILQARVSQVKSTQQHYPVARGFSVGHPDKAPHSHPPCPGVCIILWCLCFRTPSGVLRHT